MKPPLIQALQIRLEEVRQRASRFPIQAAQYSKEAACPFEVSLRRIASGDEPVFSVQDNIGRQSVPSFLRQLSQKNCEVVKLLMGRYPHAGGVTLDSEQDVAEWLLWRVMVVYRSNVEQRQFDLLNVEALLLKLNLVAIKAVSSNDLRFLDAINYYYERFPEEELEGLKPAWMYSSCLAIYERALAERKKDLLEE